MKIGGIYCYHDGEGMIYHWALGSLYEEIREVVFSTRMNILPEKHANGVESFRRELGLGLKRVGWRPEVEVPLAAAVGAKEHETKIDFLKVHYNGSGIGVEIQFGYETRVTTQSD
jgi:hypothetical protein